MEELSQFLVYKKKHFSYYFVSDSLSLRGITQELNALVHFYFKVDGSPILQCLSHDNKSNWKNELQS